MGEAGNHRCCHERVSGRNMVLFLSGFLSFVFRVHPFLKKGWFMTFVFFCVY